MNKAVSDVILILLFVSTLSLACNIRLGTTNPIPIPSLWMPEEYINARIAFDHGRVWAKVNGTYPFYHFNDPQYNLTLDRVVMYYPVPPDAEEVSVEMNETSLSWDYDWDYSTVIGDFPMIYWIIEPVPDGFTVSTYYEHPLPRIGENYTFLYAMGTGKYLDYYAKETTAYVNVSIAKDVAQSEGDISVYTIARNDTTWEWIWKPANYTIIQNGWTWIITLTVVSEELYPLEEDLLLTIKAQDPPAVGGIDIQINKLSLLAPYVGLSILLAAAAITVVYVKKRKRGTR